MNAAEIAKAVVGELLLGNSIWLLLFVICLTSGLGAFFGRYLEKKAENVVTREDFNQLQEQLRQSTNLVEGVKSSIARIDWVEREWATLRIKKIEELMTTLYECEEYLNVHRNEAIAGRHHGSVQPVDKAIVVAQLYLPELYDMVAEYSIAFRDNVTATNDALLQVLGGANHTEVWKEYMQTPVYKKLRHSLETTRVATTLLLKSIVTANPNSTP